MGTVTHSGLEPGPEEWVKGIPPVWGNRNPQGFHPERLASTSNIPIVQCFFAMFLQRKEHVHVFISWEAILSKVPTGYS